MSLIARAECPVCGFWKNSDADVGGPCRRIGCDGTVERVEYVLASQLAGAVERAERAERLVALYRENGSADLTRLVEYEAKITAERGQ